jgi:hypothetical protein
MDVFVLMTYEFERMGSIHKSDISGVLNTNDFPTRSAIFEEMIRGIQTIKKPTTGSIAVISFSIDPDQVGL